MNDQILAAVTGFLVLSNALAFHARPAVRFAGFGKSRQRSCQTVFQPMMAVDPSVAEGISAISQGARTEAYLWFFGGSGGVGIALAQFPKLNARRQKIQELSGVGPTAGGGMVGISPICLYPEDIRLADLEKILENSMTATEIVQEGPKTGSFFAERGYLTYDAFVACNPGANPLALRGVFDTFATSNNIVEPSIAQAQLDTFRSGVAAKDNGKAFANALLSSKVKGYAAISALLFLLGIVAVILAENVYVGWFPDWPGGKNLPWGLLDPGIASIPQYW
eukprot:CAMPEP_0113317608 /NCGR_PEP_ID=MMETSP0010_2-20120614/12443_1 /TAXON_ID=216773 ORGANISM="Corethron hystrix, Strain 308" /NCGR_SAMPLE_ID=MMETSP0010_2 /ASSEMBLY_ACC=CAM_ASM_000155 /LENGTH=278 /DNA_ID=CAMNT_0000174613 /DNA_START=34 /DNA_END=867 /DNA_ORIENTATION=- /assembly_acc=CAM_ASM_000155